MYAARGWFSTWKSSLFFTLAGTMSVVITIPAIRSRGLVDLWSLVCWLSRHVPPRQVSFPRPTEWISCRPLEVGIHQIPGWLCRTSWSQNAFFLSWTADWRSGRWTEPMWRCARRWAPRTSSSSEWRSMRWRRSTRRGEWTPVSAFRWQREKNKPEAFLSVQNVSSEHCACH